MRVEVKVEQRVYLRVDDQHNAAAAATIATVGPAEGLELLAVHRGAAVTAGAGARVDDDAVDKPRSHRNSSNSSSVTLLQPHTRALSRSQKDGSRRLC